MGGTMGMIKVSLMTKTGNILITHIYNKPYWLSLVGVLLCAWAINRGVNMDIKHGSCCDLAEQKVNFWFTNSGELVVESELLSRLYDYF